jgi:cell division protein FtsW (lipid II flippase)
MSWIISAALLAVIAALATAGLFMLRRARGEGEGDGDGPKDKRMARALAVRVALSVALFLFILFSYWMGWITPTGVPVGR